jgi:aldehyde:ferredoxin oxidoreductase
MTSFSNGFSLLVPEIIQTDYLSKSNESCIHAIREKAFLKAQQQKNCSDCNMNCTQQNNRTQITTTTQS